MKKLLLIVAVVGISIATTAFTYSTFKAPVEKSESSGYFDVRFQNKCSNDVKLRIEAFGSASEGTLYKGSTEQKPVQAGYKIYVNGEFFRKMEDADAGKTFVVCD
jgi:hypothetical protein